MPREILELTPTGGIFCPVTFDSHRVFHHARANYYSIAEILNQIRLGDDTETGFQTDGEILRWAMGLICDSGMGRSLAHDARFDGWAFQLEDGDEDSGPAKINIAQKCAILPKFADSNAVFARSPTAKMQLLLEMLRALRMIWQENTDLKQIDGLTARDHINRERLLQADADIAALLSAYQLRETGYNDLWRYLLSSDLSPLAATLSECLDFDFTPDGIIEALGFVFPDWFADDERLSSVDYRTLNKFDARDAAPFGLETVGIEDLIQFGTLPDGFSYLEYCASEFMTDPFYTRLPDPIIRAHLGQIVKESTGSIAGEIGFRDLNLARKIFPNKTFETIA